MSRKKSDYPVGYGRPPVSGQFKKGQSGNPAGRQKGSKNVRTVVKEAMNETVWVTIEGRRRKMSKLQAGCIQQANKATGGDPKALKLMLDMMAEPLALEGEDRDPVQERARAALVIQKLNARLLASAKGEDEE